MAAVRSVMEASTLAGSRVKVTGSMSAKTGTAPLMATELPVAAKVKEGTMTSGLGRGAGVDGHAVDAVDDLGGELLLEGLDLGSLDDHARGEDGVDGVALLLPDDRLGCWDELA